MFYSDVGELVQVIEEWSVQHMNKDYRHSLQKMFYLMVAMYQFQVDLTFNIIGPVSTVQHILQLSLSVNWSLKDVDILA